MLSDVSPYGQYGEITKADVSVNVWTSPEQFPVSVFNDRADSGDKHFNALPYKEWYFTSGEGSTPLVSGLETSL